MDKKVIFAVAGSGKTTHIVSGLSEQKRTLILTYTIDNYENLHRKICDKFNGIWPENITLMKYFSFLFSFCYKPFLSDKLRARGIIFCENPNRSFTKNRLGYYMTENRYLYSNRLSLLLLENNSVLTEIQARIKKYFDELIIDEVQDFGGRDFSFLELLMSTDIDMLFVGDYNQHTYSTSHDGNVNCSLFDDRKLYEQRFSSKGFNIDCTTLTNSWRCSRNVCDFIRNNMGIDIYSNRPESDNTSIEFLSTPDASNIIDNGDIIKLHYQNAAKSGAGHKNWGEVKGVDHYQDVCVMLNKTTAIKRASCCLHELAFLTKNKLYVAITRARGNVFLIDE